MSKLSASVGSLVADRYGGWGSLFRARGPSVVLVLVLLWSISAIWVQDQQASYLHDKLATLEKQVVELSARQTSAGPSVAALGSPSSSSTPLGPLRPPLAGGTITRHFGWNLDKPANLWTFYGSIELAPDSADLRVLADQNGTVVSVATLQDGTTHVVLQHPNDLNSEYRGVEDVSVQPGDVVTAGQAIGRARRLVFRLLRDGKPLNPETELTWPAGFGP